MYSRVIRTGDSGETGLASSKSITSKLSGDTIPFGREARTQALFPDDINFNTTTTQEGCNCQVSANCLVAA